VSAPLAGWHLPGILTQTIATRYPAVGPKDPALAGPNPLGLPPPSAQPESRDGYMAIERLTAEDEMMLWPDEIWPQDIGALAILAGGGLADASGRFRLEAMRQAIGARLHLVPRLRQVLYVPPWPLGRPVWIDAPAFDIEDHVRVAPLPAPAGEAQLLRAVEDLCRQRFDRARPLWEMWFLPGLAAGRVGCFIRLHHVMADGMAAVAIMSAFLDPVPAIAAASAPPWAPAPAPSAAELLSDSLCQGVRRVRAIGSLGHPVARARRLRAAWPGTRELLARRPFPATSLTRLVGPARSIALVRAELGPVRQVAHDHGATVNDVLLAVTAGGLRDLLSSRGEPVDGAELGMYVPISLREAAGSQARGNMIGQMVIALPIGDMAPRRRLAQIAAQTAERKARYQPSLGKIPHRGITGRLALSLISRQHVNVTSADIPGPQQPLYFAGARLIEVFPLVQLLGTVSLAVGAMSYAGQLAIMAVADRDGYPDLDVFADGVRHELGALAATALAAQQEETTRRCTMKALVIFESMYGNTRAIAEAVAEGIGADGDVQVTALPVGAGSAELTRDADLLVVGGPTHAHGMSRPSTRRAAHDAAKQDSGLLLDPTADGPGVRDWLAHLEHRGGLGAAFDTRLDAPAMFTGSAATGIARKLRRSGVTAIARPESFLVTKKTDLCAGETARAREWGRQLSKLATASESGRAAGVPRS
jgi:diacylglycerol O-acyltransferase